MTRILVLCFAALSVVGLSACGSGAQAGSGQVAATVNGRPISMSSYHKQVIFKRWTTAQTNGNVDVCTTRGYGSLCNTLKQNALNDLIAAEVVRQWAGTHRIVVTQAAFNQQWTIYYKSKFHSDYPVLRAYARNLGMTPNDIKGLVRQNMLDDQVLYRVTASMATTVPATRLARLVSGSVKQMKAYRAQLRSMSFGALAAKLNKNQKSLCSTLGCGEIGWVPNELISQQHRAVTAARPGSFVGPYVNAQGYLLLLVQGHTTHFHLTAQQGLQIRELRFAAWIARQEKHATIRRYVAA